MGDLLKLGFGFAFCFGAFMVFATVFPWDGPSLPRQMWEAHRRDRANRSKRGR